ncbi:MAG TPA: signal recognition particle protein Srp19 [Methanobacterium sp.]|jgi:signal recognition particle subunit SRP19|nr:MAG: signal recognition particle protein Srp19 [Methanobacterium sp.]HOI71554.1 signal recognition particle protein Srp19 [Methanobacterium sp.]HPX78076.1 signal recognition particle protein Srp19 [Methanobacterium sp.]
MKVTIWPANIDSTKTVKEGRKIPKNNAVNIPKLREISRAATKLGLNPEVEKDKSYPKSWWESSGRVMVDKKQPKREILIKISNTIKGFRK